MTQQPQKAMPSGAAGLEHPGRLIAPVQAAQSASWWPPCFAGRRQSCCPSPDSALSFVSTASLMRWGSARIAMDRIVRPVAPEVLKIG
jgi:hypothetical protein